MKIARFSAAMTALALGLTLLSPVAGIASEVHPIVDMRSLYLLGGSSGTRWMAPLKIAPLLKGGEKYRVYAADGLIGEAKGGEAKPFGMPCSWLREIHFASLPESSKTGVVAVGGNWNALPRTPKFTSTQQIFYKREAARLLKGKGVPQHEVELEQVIRIDLDGDGKEEVLVSATYRAPESDSPGEKWDYSIVFLRKIHRGKVETIVIESYVDVFNDDPRNNGPPRMEYIFRIAGIFDLNGDGTMEIVMDWSYYEGSGVTVWEVKGLKTGKVLSAGCGA